MNLWRTNMQEKIPQQRMAAVALILVQSFTLAMLMNSLIFPICAAIIACGGLLTYRRGWSISLPGDRWIFVLIAVFVVKYSVAPRQLPFNFEFLFSEFAYEVSSFCVVVELLILFRKQNQDKLPISFLAFSIMGLVFSGNVRLDSVRRVGMLFTVQAFFVVWMWFSLKSRRTVSTSKPQSNLWRNSVMCGVLFVSSIAGTTMSVLLHRHERTLENLIGAYLALGDRGQARSGFSNRGGLSDISNWQSNGGHQLALRVVSKTEPGYLRGKVFDEFNMDRWITTLPRRTLLPVFEHGESSALSGSDHFYKIAHGFSGSSLLMEVSPVDSETAGHCFSPLDTVAVRCRTRPISVDRSKIITRPSEYESISYSILTSPIPLHDHDEIEENFLQISPSLDERVSRVADSLFTDGMSSRKKIHAVSHFFQQNFKYKLGIDIPDNEDRLGYFLESRSAAHCEYFATATAILLRQGGVPTRYVTGYLTQERNEIDKSWVARRKDAHAWVEAYDKDSQRWVLVESTPTGGVPIPSQTGRWQQRREAMSHFFQAVQDQVKRGNFTKAAWLVVLPLLWIVAVFGILAGLFVLMKRKLPKKREAVIEFDEIHSALSHERVRMDKLLAKIGLHRFPSETTTQFADRIETDSRFDQAAQVSLWYRTYSACRFRPVYRPDDLEDLRIQRERISHSWKHLESGENTHV